MKELVKNALILCCITLVAGLLLGTVYEVTKAPRAKQEELAKQKSYQAVFKDADKFDELSYDMDEMAVYLEENGISGSMAYVNEVVTAMDNGGNALGYVITVTDKEGYGGEIKFAVGIQNNGTVNGISILSISETAGLGMKAKEGKFKNQFNNKKVEEFVYTKAGASADNEIDAISGATITTNAVTNGVNAAIKGFGYLVNNNQGGAENE